AEHHAEMHQVFSSVGRDDFKTALNKYIQGNYPGSTVNGFAEEARNMGMYLIAVDVVHPTRRDTVRVIGQIFRSADDDKPYWKMETPTRDLVLLLGIGDTNKIKDDSQ